MKKILLFVMALAIGLSVAAQHKSFQSGKNNFLAPRPTMQIDDQVLGVKPVNSTVANKAVLDDPILMTTKYDQQTNNATTNYFYKYADGTMAATSIMAHLDDFTDRGTGYNYYNGTAWGAAPAARLETRRTGWGNYAPCGPNGEIVVSHVSGTQPLIINIRPAKGTGAWTETELAAPAGAAGMLWPRLVSSGTDHNTIHIIAMTSPVANGGTVYNSLDGALLYNRSVDAGATWEGWLQLDGMTSLEYLAFGGDSYAFAEPRGNTIAFTYGDSWFDQSIMKSTDNGTTWTKTVIWPCPYNFWQGGDTTGRFWCVDGTMAVAIDNDSKVHVTMGLQQGDGNEAGEKFWVPFTDGLLYWNEDMPTWPEVLDPDTLEAHGNLIGWVQDTMIWYAATTELAYYYCSLSGQPTMSIDEFNNIFVVWAGVTNLRDANSFMLRHLFARAWAVNEGAWMDNIMDITNDFAYNWSECVYPNQVPNSYDNNIYTLFQADLEAGVYLKGTSGAQGQTAITNNDLIVITTSKEDIIAPGVGVEDPGKAAFNVAQNMPNPFNGNTMINVQLEKTANLSLTVYSVVGQKVMEISKGSVNPGAYQFVVDGSQLQAGVYFYTVKANKESVTKKMIVR